jgi:hypothetical protein
MLKIKGNYTYFSNINAKVTMKKIIIVAALFLFWGTMFGQKINGQWRGYFDSKGDIIQASGENTEYVLEIEINGTEISGYSYSYFYNRRYFVICSLAGTYYKSTKSMKVTETARIKGSTPPDWNDCLQTHILSYEKDGNTEELKGRWLPADGQLGNCGKGVTTLTRRTLSKDLASYNKSISKPVFSDKKLAPAPPIAAQKKATTTAPPVVNTKPAPGEANLPVVKTSPKPKPVAPAPTIPKPKANAIEPAIVGNKPLDRTAPEMIVPQIKSPAIQLIPTEMGFEKRSNNIIKTIEIDHSTFKVDLYDNGDVDGDSISLFYDGKLLLSHKMLSEKPISLTLDAQTGKEMELTMYADNLGIIPPNTALMVVTDGEKRYEVRIASDLKRSGSIRFKLKPDAAGTSVSAKGAIK